MGSPLKTLVALVMVLAMLAFVYTAYATADDESFTAPAPLEEMSFRKAGTEQPAPPPPPLRMDRPKAIMPEESVELVLGDESENDSKNKSGRKNPQNTPTTAKREYHRKMMQR